MESISHFQFSSYYLVKLIFHAGICADIAVSKNEHWSSFAPLPFEVVISAGQKAKEESWDGITSYMETMVMLNCCSESCVVIHN